MGGGKVIGMKNQHLPILLIAALFCCSCISIPAEKNNLELPPSLIQTEPVQPIEPELEIAEPATEKMPILGETSIIEEEEPQVTYILNKNTKKFHKPTCRSAQQISPKNYEESFDTREEVVAQGYSPCGNCKP